MMKNDINCVLPDENGIRICTLSLRELSRIAINLTNQIEKEGYKFLCVRDG
jgi:hypothetical protein